MTPNKIMQRGLIGQCIYIIGEGEAEILDAHLYFNGEKVGVNLILNNKKKIFVPANIDMPGIFVA